MRSGPEPVGVPLECDLDPGLGKDDGACTVLQVLDPYQIRRLRQVDAIARIALEARYHIEFPSEAVNASRRPRSAVSAMPQAIKSTLRLILA